MQAGEVPDAIFHHVNRIVEENERAVEAAFACDLSACLDAFKKDHLLASLSDAQKEELFSTMYEATKEYLKDYR